MHLRLSLIVDGEGTVESGAFTSCLRGVSKTTEPTINGESRCRVRHACVTRTTSFLIPRALSSGSALVEDAQFRERRVHEDVAPDSVSTSQSARVAAFGSRVKNNKKPSRPWDSGVRPAPPSQSSPPSQHSGRRRTGAGAGRAFGHAAPAAAGWLGGLALSKASVCFCSGDKRTLN